MEPRFISVNELQIGDKIAGHAMFLSPGCHLFIAVIEDDEPEEYESHAGAPMLLFKCSSIVLEDGQKRNPYNAIDQIPNNSIVLSVAHKIMLLERKC